MSVLRNFPAIVILLIIAAAMMLVPMLHAAIDRNWLISRTFLYHSLFFMIFGVIVGLATMNRVPRTPARYHLVSLLAGYILLPAVLAAPLSNLVLNVGFGELYFEMLSCLTTTGATIFERPALIADTIHLWRAIIGWVGGLMVLITAFTVLAPLRLGGFEISQYHAADSSGHKNPTVDDAGSRIIRSSRMIIPPYTLFTASLAIILILLGEKPFVAICHALSTLSTSGISPVGGLEGAQAGRLGEIVLAGFLTLAISHRGISSNVLRGRVPSFSDPQVQLMLICIGSVTAILFLRSFAGASGIERQGNIVAIAQGLWGSIFTVLSFLTTTGFESNDWRTMQIWSGLPNPGFMLIGVAMMGGGIATTAGGIKLLRIYALYRHGLREMDRLIHPSSIGRQGQGDKLISERGAKVAFVFLMLFLTALAVIMVLFSATGLNFDQSLTMAVASLTTTGPVISTLSDGFTYAELDGLAKIVYSVGMITGRLEVLVVIALFNPTYWHN